MKWDSKNNSMKYYSFIVSKNTPLYILSSDIPDKSNRQTLLFSATFSKEIQKTVTGALSDNFLLATNNIEDYVTNDNIEQIFYYVEEKDKSWNLHSILQQCRGTAIGKHNRFIIYYNSLFG